MIVVGNRPTQDTSQKSQFIIFQVLKKGYIEMTEKIYLETFEKCPGSVCFPLLHCVNTLDMVSDNYSNYKEAILDVKFK